MITEAEAGSQSLNIILGGPKSGKAHSLTPLPHPSTLPQERLGMAETDRDLGTQLLLTNILIVQ